LITWLGAYIAEVLGRQTGDVTDALSDSKFCACAPPAAAPAKQPIVIHLNTEGYVVSSNPVWNACVKGEATLGLIKSNTDKVLHRQGGTEVSRPFTCSDYHKNNRNEWRHPDHPELIFMLDKKGKLMIGTLPKGFVAKKIPQGIRTLQHGHSIPK
jgi:hypothetical protein